MQAAGQFLGIGVEHDLEVGMRTVHQQAYIEGMVRKYECENEFDALLDQPPSVLFKRDEPEMGYE